MNYRHDRSLLLEHDPAKIAPDPIESIKDQDWRHQEAAMVNGYNSVAEMAIDELLGMVRELTERVDRLEGRLHRVGWATQPLGPELDP